MNSISVKLFLALFGLTSVVLLAGLGLARWSLNYGFNDYLNSVQEQRLELIAQQLVALMSTTQRLGAIRVVTTQVVALTSTAQRLGATRMQVAATGLVVQADAAVLILRWCRGDCQDVLKQSSRTRSVFARAMHRSLLELIFLLVVLICPHLVG